MNCEHINGESKAESFSADKITDRKRYARGEQLRFAKTLLQARDEVHHASWKVLMLAGPEPSGEINSIRSLMPKSVIIAVDINPESVEKARLAGADCAVCCDLSKFEVSGTGAGTIKKPCVEMQNVISQFGNLDILHLDFCGSPCHTMKLLISVGLTMLSGRGVLILTFSYGRDVTAMFRESYSALHRSQRGKADAACSVLGYLLEKGASESIVERLSYVFSTTSIAAIRSVIQYSGPQMPMCSVLVHKKEYPRPHPDDVSFVKAGVEEFNLCVTHPDVRTLYDCPEEKLKKIKASMAAQKAVATRKSRLALA